MEWAQMCSELVKFSLFVIKAAPTCNTDTHSTLAASTAAEILVFYQKYDFVLIYNTITVFRSEDVITFFVIKKRND